MLQNGYPNIDRRSAKRQIAKFTMRYKIVGQQELPLNTATTVNISSKSLAFETAHSLALGTVIDSEILLPHLPQPLKIRGSINRSEEFIRANKEKIYSYSMVLQDINEHDRATLEQYIQTFDIDSILRMAVKKNASDVHLIAHQPPVMRIDGELAVSDAHPLSPENIRQMILGMMTEKQKLAFNRNLELDFSYIISEGVRFRVNLHLEKGNLEAAFRAIPSQIKTVQELGLPAAVEDLARRKKGLIIISGPAGNGKSTTLAAIIDLINRERKCMIISIEDPIEYVYTSKKSMIKQREVGTDTLSFELALKYVFRQDPNVILVGEMRDLESISMAITAAETGHVVFSTLHTPDTIECINRIINVFPDEQKNLIRNQLASCLEGIVAQVLLPKKEGTGRIVATEVLIATPAVKNLIRTGHLEQIYSYIETGIELGMHTMDSSLLRLVQSGMVSKDSAMGFTKNLKKFGDSLK